MVDQQAKTSLSLKLSSFKIPFSNFKPSINKYILEEWLTSCSYGDFSVKISSLAI